MGDVAEGRFVSMSDVAEGRFVSMGDAVGDGRGSVYMVTVCITQGQAACPSDTPGDDWLACRQVTAHARL